ncbi:MAG: NAD-dependent deacylase [Gammaproteobacteria bacterium]|jgi:NAD-dependent deacetylase|nr:NAD-dependent protein deacylase [Chromatiales bacterium]MDP6675643.1 NAD-dependent deacylase [Gammaproteobacteria bacterium]
MGSDREIDVFPPALIDALVDSRHIVVMTGSGTSAESGIPTFRDAQTGLWAKYRPEDLATPEAFARNPQLVSDWYEWRRQLVSKTDPNPGHTAIAALTKLVKQLTLITQNVDGLHQRAGNDDVIEFHGNIMLSRCTDGHPATGIQGDTESPPRCEQCGAMIRPAVVWFGESIPAAVLQRALAAVETCDVFFAIGTSAQVQPAAGLALLAKQNGATLIEINPAETPLTDDCDYILKGPSGAILPKLVSALKQTSDHA